MCYLCKQSTRLKAADKAIREAARVWRKKEDWRDVGAAFRRSWGFSHDWTKAPPKLAKLPERADVPQGDGLWPVEANAQP